MKKHTTELGKVISEAREKLGISQRELARQAKMDCAEVSRIEAGKRLKPNVLYLKGIADTLGLSLVDLMKYAGYDDTDINWGRDLTSKRSITDYQNQIKEYKDFYFDVLQDLEDRRMNAFACKGLIAELIDKVEQKKISNDEILEDLKELLNTIRPSLEKLDKSKYPKIDTGLMPKEDIKTRIRYNTITGKNINEKE